VVNALEVNHSIVLFARLLRNSCANAMLYAGGGVDGGAEEAI
jgi:hypothetical protein